MCQSGATHLPMDWNKVNVSEWSDTFLPMDWNKVNVSECCFNELAL